MTKPAENPPEPLNPDNPLSVDKMMLIALQEGYSPTAIANKLGCDKAHVCRTLKPYKDRIEAYMAFKNNPEELWEYSEFMALSSVNINKLKEASPRDQITIAGIARDKVNIAQGKAPIEAGSLVFNVVSNGDATINLNISMEEHDVIDVTPVDNT